MNKIASRRPQTSEFECDAYRPLIDALGGDCVLQILDDQMYWLCELASYLSTEQVDKVHAPYSWSIRQVFEHCAVAERVNGYRINRMAAGDETELAGWDQDQFAAARYGLGNFGSIVSEIGLLRQANLLLLRRIVPRAWDRSGVVDGARASVRALAWVTAGHLRHHLEIVERRCDLSVPRMP